MFSQSKVSSVPSAARQIHFWGWWSSTSKPDNTNTRNPSPTEPIMTSWPRLLPRVQTIRTSVTQITCKDLLYFFRLSPEKSANKLILSIWWMSNTLTSWNSWHLMYKLQIVSLTQSKSRTLTKLQSKEHHMTPCDAYTRRLESYYADVLDMYVKCNYGLNLIK